jgi:hypothetical protein
MSWKPTDIRRKEKPVSDPFTFGGFTPDMRRAMIRCHDAKMNVADAAKEIGVSATLLSKESWMWGLEFPNPPSPLKGKPRPGCGWSDSDKQLLTELAARGLNGREIATAMSKPRETCFWYAHKLGVKIGKNKNVRPF